MRVIIKAKAACCFFPRMLQSAVWEVSIVASGYADFYVLQSGP
jgi:hypothetical protein